MIGPWPTTGPLPHAAPMPHAAGAAAGILRQRRTAPSEAMDSAVATASTPAPPPLPSLPPPSYFLVRILFLRLLGLVFLAANLAALNQNVALLGAHGLVPACAAAGLHTGHPIVESVGSVVQLLLAFVERPNLLLFAGCNDDTITAIALLGVAVASIVLVIGSCNVLLLLVLYLVQVSLVNLGSPWYSFGWETQLLETALWTAIALSLMSLRRFDALLGPSLVIAALVQRWLIAKVMVGAGLIKLRGDACWRDLLGNNCMLFHYETQPNPGPLSWYLHWSSPAFHALETAGNHFIELAVPLLLVPFLPRRCRIVGGAVLIAFQCILILSGNLAFLNWCTLLPCLWSLDDRAVGFLFSKVDVEAAAAAAAESRALLASVISKTPWAGLEWRRIGLVVRSVLALAAACCYCLLQQPVVANLLSSSQAMNRSFSSWHVSGTYGAFGSVSKVRTEVVFEGTNASSPSEVEGSWVEYELPCKPGAVSRRACLVTPYHLRLDWSAWFAAMASYQHYPWSVNLVDKLLAHEPFLPSSGSLVAALRYCGLSRLIATDARQLLSFNPFPTRRPRFIRALLYEYRFSTVAQARTVRASTGTPFNASAVGDALCRQLPTAWAWPVLRECAAFVHVAPSGPFMSLRVSGLGAGGTRVTFEVGSLWSRRLLREWLPALERGNPSVRAFLEGHHIRTPI